MATTPGQSAILSGSGYSPWQAPLAALFSGISAAGQPGGWSNFGAGVTQGQQNFQRGQAEQQMMDLRRQQIAQAEEEQRRANQEREEAQALKQRLKDGLLGGPGSPTPTMAHGGYGVATGGVQTASGSPVAAMFGGDPQKAAIFNMMVESDPNAALQFIAEQQFSSPDAPKTVGGMQWDGDSFEPIPGYTEQAAAIASAGRNPVQGPGPTERERNAVAAGLKPGTPEFQQYILGRDDTAPGPFQGTGLDAQSYNIVLTGDPNSPEYKAAYAQLAMPKVTFDPVTQKMVSVAPDMSWARPPAGGAAPAAPTAAPDQAGVETMNLPGATVTSTQGAPVYNETQGKAAGFADRMTEANAIFDEASVSNAGQSLAQSGLSSIPVLGNFLTSKERQKFEQAERNFINSQLRRESGAVISPEEFANARAQYIPQPGDSKEVLAQKKANRELNIQSMQRESGPFYKPKSAPEGENPYSNMTDEEFENELKKRQVR